MVVIRKIMNDVTACRWMLLLTADTCVVPEPMMKCANQNAMILHSVERSSSWYILHLPYIDQTLYAYIPTHLGIKQRIHTWLSHGDDSSSSLHPAIVPARVYINPRLSNNQQIPTPFSQLSQRGSLVNSHYRPSQLPA